ncbi:MAG: hypothetical protein ABIV94_04615 [Acidimicrobiales bacterium]
MAPIIQQAAVDLAGIAAKNTASSVFDRVRTARARREKDETIRELEEIVNGLIADKLELQRVADVYREAVLPKPSATRTWHSSLSTWCPS